MLSRIKSKLFIIYKYVLTTISYSFFLKFLASPLNSFIFRFSIYARKPNRRVRPSTARTKLLARTTWYHEEETRRNLAPSANSEKLTTFLWPSPRNEAEGRPSLSFSVSLFIASYTPCLSTCTNNVKSSFDRSSNGKTIKYVCKVA